MPVSVEEKQHFASKLDFVLIPHHVQELTGSDVKQNQDHDHLLHDQA